MTLDSVILTIILIEIMISAFIAFYLIPKK